MEVLRHNRDDMKRTASKNMLKCTTLNEVESTKTHIQGIILLERFRVSVLIFVLHKNVFAKIVLYFITNKLTFNPVKM